MLEIKKAMLQNYEMYGLAGKQMNVQLIKRCFITHNLTAHEVMCLEDFNDAHEKAILWRAM